MRSSLNCVVATLLAPVNKCLSIMLVRLLQPIRHQHGLFLKAVATRRGATEQLGLWALGGWRSAVVDTVRLLTDRFFLKDLGLLRPGSAQPVFEALAVEDENLLCQYALNLTIHLVGQRCLSNLWYSHSLPMKFAGLLASSTHAREETLATLRKWWAVWDSAEAQQWVCPEIGEWLHDILWMSWGWVRRLMICLLEHEFSECPCDVREEVQGMISCMASTKQTEDAIGTLRKQESASQSGKLELSSRWRTLLMSSVLRDADRPEVHSTAASRHQSQQSRLTSRIYDPESAEQCHQVDETLLKRLVNEKPDHRSPSATRFDQSNLQWLTLQSISPNFEELSKQWWNSFVVVGTIVQNERSKVAGLVIYASPFGCLGWKLNIEKIGGKHYFTLKSSALDDNWFHFSVADPDTWQGSAVEAISPRMLFSAHSGLEDQDKARAMVIRIRSKHRPLSLLALSAQHGFRNCTIPILKRLWDSEPLAALVIGKKRPGKEEDWVKQLAELLCPGPVDLDQVWQARGRKMHLDNPVPLDPTVLQEAAACFEPSDFGELEHCLSAERDEEAVPSAQADETIQGGSMAAVEIPRRLPKPAGSSAAWSLDQVKELCPQGAMVSRESTWHTRWRVHFPKFRTPNRCSACWGGQVSERQAVLKVVGLAWQIYARETGRQCPWELE